MFQGRSRFLDENHNFISGDSIEHFGDEFSPSSPILFDDEACESDNDCQYPSSPLLSFNSQSKFYPLSAPFGANTSNIIDFPDCDKLQIDLITDLLEIVFTRNAGDDETISQKVLTYLASSQPPSIADTQSSDQAMHSSKLPLSDNPTRNLSAKSAARVLHQRLQTTLSELEIMFELVFGAGIIRQLAVSQLWKSICAPKIDQFEQNYLSISTSSSQTQTFSNLEANRQTLRISSMLEKLSLILHQCNRQFWAFPAKTQVFNTKSVEQNVNQWSRGLPSFYMRKLRALTIVLRAVKIGTSDVRSPHMLFTCDATALETVRFNSNNESTYTIALDEVRYVSLHTLGINQDFEMHGKKISCQMIEMPNTNYSSFGSLTQSSQNGLQSGYHKEYVNTDAVTENRSSQHDSCCDMFGSKGYNFPAIPIL